MEPQKRQIRHSTVWVITGAVAFVIIGAVVVLAKMIFTDDQRHDAVGYAGNDAVQTPNLDRLAKQGLIFQNCFVRYTG